MANYKVLIIAIINCFLKVKITDVYLYKYADFILMAFSNLIPLLCSMKVFE